MLQQLTPDSDFYRHSFEKLILKISWNVSWKLFLTPSLRVSLAALSSILYNTSAYIPTSTWDGSWWWIKKLNTDPKKTGSDSCWGYEILFVCILPSDPRPHSGLLIFCIWSECCKVTGHQATFKNFSCQSSNPLTVSNSSGIIYFV